MREVRDVGLRAEAGPGEGPGWAGSCCLRGVWIWWGGVRGGGRKSEKQRPCGIKRCGSAR